MQEKLSKEEKVVLERLSLAQKNAEEGTGISHQEVMKEARQWLKK